MSAAGVDALPLDIKLLCPFNDEFAFSCRNVMGDLCGIPPVRHHKNIKLLMRRKFIEEKVLKRREQPPNSVKKKMNTFSSFYMFSRKHLIFSYYVRFALRLAFKGKITASKSVHKLLKSPLARQSPLNISCNYAIIRRTVANKLVLTKYIVKEKRLQRIGAKTFCYK